MVKKIDELIALSGYQYRVWDYQVSHSVLTIKATKTDLESVIFIHFGDVYYLQTPISWVGDFVLSSDTEFREFVSKAGLTGPVEVYKQALSLFKATTSGNLVYILGALISVENRSE
jgi:hypothetical protein